MGKPDEDKHDEMINIKNMHDNLVPEEFPEGPLGSPINSNMPVQGKSTPWKEGQRRQSAYIYADKEIHAGLPRQAPGSHPLHDSKMNKTEEDNQE